MHTIIFAKQPLAGFAKTRLIPALGANAAADLANTMLHLAVGHAVAAGLGSVTLNYTPRDWAVSDFFSANQSLRFLPQVEGDLGERMSAACQTVSRGQQAQPVLLMGTDCPGLTGDILQQMHQALEEYDACLVPANDGGYVALAMRSFNASLFTDIAWSTDSVAEATREKMRQLNWRWLELPTLVDIDEAQDLPFLPEHLRHFLPA